MIRNPIKTIEELTPFDYKVLMEMIIAMQTFPAKKSKERGPTIIVNGVTVTYVQFHYLFGSFVQNHDEDPHIDMLVETMRKMALEAIAERRESAEKQLREVIQQQIQKAEDES